MFGTLKPRPCALPTADRAAWRRLYCGTCKGLHAHHGTPHRALLSHDVVLLAGIVEGVQGGASPCGTCRCPVAPLIHRPILQPDSPAMRIASAVQVLLADEWLADRAVEGGSAASWARPLLSGARGEALETLTDLGVDTTGFDDLAARQAGIEQEDGVDLARAASPTVALLGRLVASAADLPDTDPALATAASRGALRRLGEDLGRVIYGLDVLDDLEDDARGGAFNPCLTVSASGVAVPDASRVEAAIRFVHEATARLSEAVRSFPWRRNRVVLEHVVAEQLPRRVAATVTASRDTVSRATEAELVRWRDAPWWQRWGWLLAGWLSALFAAGHQQRKRKKKERGEGCCSGCDCIDCCLCAECGCDAIDCCDCLGGCDGCDACDCCSCCDCG